MALSVAVIRSRVGASWLDMGFDVRRIGKDVYLGCAAFVMMAPIVFGLQALVTTYFQQTKHPLIEIAREGRDPWFLLAAGSAAVIIAPVTEEWVFRVVLQGWLQKLFANLPSPREEVEWAAVDKPQLESGPDRTGFAAIVVSSVLFSAIHLNHGGDFVALFVLALGLGYLYYRTNRILPSIVVHMLLNGSTFIMLAAQVFGWLPDVEAAP
ncbi:MAG: CPBP family intramembrane metalloprotease, partial [Pirellulaceae bacterium]|nr:CPBP family intramembrane metalloprotease [Pirellulaceae bacterium]